MKTLNIIAINILFLVQSSFSQDSLFFKNKNVLAVKLVEITQNEIKYFPTKNVDGPIYTINKTDVAFIKYYNGVVDTIKVIESSDNTSNLSEPKVVAYQKINIVGKKLLYGNKSLGDRKLKFLINNYPHTEAKEMLLEEFRKMKNLEMTQKVYAPVGFLVGFAIPVAASYYALSGSPNDPEGIFLGGVIIGAVVRITSNVIHHVSGNKRHAAKRQIALLYNQNL